jgi:hypothetical protein
MRNILMALIAAVTGLIALGATAAYAGPDRSYRPDRCTIDHDHRSHASNYYNYYPADRYFRTGQYNGTGFSLSISVGDNGYDRRSGYGRYNRNDHGRRNGYRGRDGRVVNREVFDTRYRARIILVEEAVRTRNGPRLVCTVKARGPEAGYVSERRMRRIANRNCSSRARIQVYA